MKKFLASILVMAMAATALTGCGGGAAEAPADDAAGYKVAYIARAQSDSFAAWLANEMIRAAGEYEDITLDVFDGQADDAKENA
ncbi:MAG: sugar ABC transporter substrate-binding protein, partial [Anaerotignum sp.]|nr:sugar ABC transporter substrate-binding protein [Anaerotignum sp.]